MDKEIILVIYLLIMVIAPAIVAHIFLSKRIGIKKTLVLVVLSDLILFVGALYISFYLFKNEEFYLKYPTVIMGVLFLIMDIYQCIKPKSKFDLIKEEENKWRKEQK